MTDAKAPEPSIEEILASIRKIISDDEPGEGEGGASHGETLPIAEPEDEEILELTDVVFTTPTEDTDRLIDDQAHEESSEPTTNVTPLYTPMNQIDDHEEHAEPPIMTRSSDQDSELASGATIQAASGALAKLAHLEPPEPPVSSSTGRGLSVEDLTRELLKPMLRQWMDQNLPGLVERLVERELRKITRKAEDL